MYEYKMIQVPPTIVVKEKERRGQEVAYSLESIVNEQAAKGWEFYRVDTIGVVITEIAEPRGALIREDLREYYVVTFRRSK